MRGQLHLISRQERQAHKVELGQEEEESLARRRLWAKVWALPNVRRACALQPVTDRRTFLYSLTYYLLELGALYIYIVELSSPHVKVAF